jgi:hypothetical protein
MTIKELKEKLATSRHCADLDLEYHLTEEGIKDEDDAETVHEYLQELIEQEEIIYYYTAMQFLTEYDTSLQTSLGLANKFGYTADRLNSELLATLLIQDLMSDELNEIYP